MSIEVLKEDRTVETTMKLSKEGEGKRREGRSDGTVQNIACTTSSSSLFALPFPSSFLPSFVRMIRVNVLDVRC